MRALRNFAERDLRVVEVDDPSPPGDDEVQVRIRAVALNHIDVWGWRGMAFAKRKLPMTVGAAPPISPAAWAPAMLPVRPLMVGRRLW